LDAGIGNPDVGNRDTGIPDVLQSCDNNPQGGCRIVTNSGRYLVPTTDRFMLCTDPPYGINGGGSLLGDYACTEPRESFYLSQAIRGILFVTSVQEDVRFDAELWCNNTRVGLETGTWHTRSAWAGQRVNMVPRFVASVSGACEIRFFVETRERLPTLVARRLLTVLNQYPPAHPTASPMLTRDGQGPALSGYVGVSALCPYGVEASWTGNPDVYDPLIPVQCTRTGFVSSNSRFTRGTTLHLWGSGLSLGTQWLALISKDNVYHTERLIITDLRSPGNYAFAYNRVTYRHAYYGQVEFTPEEPGTYAINWFVRTPLGWQYLTNSTLRNLVIELKE